MKYLFSLIFLINVFSYSLLILKPLNYSTEFTVNEGDSLSKIFFDLEKKNIYFPKTMKLVFNLFEADKRVFYGKYNVTLQDSLLKIFNKIFFGKISLKEFIIPEGSQIKNLFTKEVIDEYCLEQDIVNSCNLEGYLKPDIYYYDRDSELIDILRKSISSQNKILDKAWKDRKSNLENYTKFDILIIASILEKEACSNEREKISGVIFNRLNLKMLLQMDSTTIYGLKEFNGNIKKKHLKDSSLYNTYMHNGLPPGPISNPSRNSLFAAGQPESHDFLYFVAKNKCEHEFSVNYDDHLMAVKKYQLKK